MDAEKWQQVREAYHRMVADADDASGSGEPPSSELACVLGAGDPPSDFLEPPASTLADLMRATPVEDALAGRRIGAYRVLGVLGRGGMGVVYEAEQENPRRLVALKVVRALPLVDDLTPRLLRREGQALARLQHPGVAAIHEAGRSEEGWHWFAMELVRGTPLTTYAREHQLGIPERLKLFQEVCDAVHYAHQRGVIHRDLKPANILVATGDQGGLRTEDSGLSKDGSAGNPHSVPTSAQPKILDFGLARITDPDAEYTQITEPGAFQGTLAYASPEQARGRPDAIDVRTDVYSLGVILYELVTDRLPYDVAAASLSEAARIICEQAPASLSFRTPHGSGGPGSKLKAHRGDLATIVGKALAKEPDRRYASVSQLASDITHYLGNEPISARPASALYQLRKLAVRHKAPFAIAGIALGLILALTAWMIVLFLRARGAEAQATRERDESVAARQREADARSSAEAVAEFLEKLFEQGEPESAVESGNPTVRDLLEAGVARLDELADQPLVYARLAHTLGGVYIQLADFPRARKLLESAVSIRERELGNAHPDVAESLKALADLARRMGEHDRAHTLLLRALEIRRAHYGEPHEEVAAALEDLGAERFYAGDNRAAADYFQQSLDVRQTLGSQEHLHIAISLHNLGSALQRLGRLNDAEESLLRALEIRRRLAKPDVCKDAIGLGLTLEALAHIPYDRGDFAAAEQYLAEQVAAFRLGCPPSHPKIAWGLRNYAFLIEKNHGPTRAEPILREALAIQVASFGEQHPEVANTLGSLAYNRMDQDDPEGAVELQQKALNIRRAVLGENHDMVAGSLRILGEFYRKAERFDEAESALLEGHAILTGNYGEHGKQSRGIVQALIALYDDKDQCNLADEWRARLAEIEASQ